MPNNKRGKVDIIIKSILLTYQFTGSIKTVIEKYRNCFHPLVMTARVYSTSPIDDSINLM